MMYLFQIVILNCIVLKFMQSKFQLSWYIKQGSYKYLNMEHLLQNKFVGRLYCSSNKIIFFISSLCIFKISTGLPNKWLTSTSENITQHFTKFQKNCKSHTNCVHLITQRADPRNILGQKTGLSNARVAKQNYFQFHSRLIC